MKVCAGDVPGQFFSLALSAKKRSQHLWEYASGQTTYLGSTEAQVRILPPILRAVGITALCSSPKRTIEVQFLYCTAYVWLHNETLKVYKCQRRDTRQYLMRRHWELANPSGCKPPRPRRCRFDSYSTHYESVAQQARAIGSYPIGWRFDPSQIHKCLRNIMAV